MSSSGLILVNSFTLSLLIFSRRKTKLYIIALYFLVTVMKLCYKQLVTCALLTHISSLFCVMNFGIIYLIKLVHHREKPKKNVMLRITGPNLQNMMITSMASLNDNLQQHIKYINGIASSQHPPTQQPRLPPVTIFSSI